MKDCNCDLKRKIGCDENCNFSELQEKYGKNIDVDKLVLLRDWCNERRAMIKEINELKNKVKELGG